MPWSTDADVNLSKTARGAIRRFITQRVLVADICRHRFANVHDFRRGVREVRLASCLFGELPKNLGVLIRAVLIKQANCIYDHVSRLCQSQNLTEIMLAGVVSPVADQDENSLLMLVGLKMTQSYSHGV